MSDITQHWTSIFGKPERITEKHYIDDYGSWDSQFYRKDGSFIGFKPSTSDLYRTKDQCEKAAKYKIRVAKAISRVKYD